MQCLEEFIELETESDLSVLVKMTVINRTTLFYNREREKAFILLIKTIHLIVSFPFPLGQNWTHCMTSPKPWASPSFTPSVTNPNNLQTFCSEVSYVFSFLSLGEFK